jgi:hypothetical protein
VDFKELVMRNRAYLKEEKEAMDQFLHKDGKCMGSAASKTGTPGAAGPAAVTTGGAN